jgi:hypothetical protein
MANTKSSTKTSPGKRPAAVVASVVASSTAKAKPAPKAKLATKPEPVAKAKAVPKAAPKPAPKAVTGKPASAQAKKPVAIPLEKRKHYVEMAAYYIAERRGFAPGDLLDDWVRAEAEIDRLLAEGRLGG